MQHEYPTATTAHPFPWEYPTYVPSGPAPFAQMELTGFPTSQAWPSFGWGSEYPTYVSVGLSPTAVYSPIKQECQERPQPQLVPMPNDSQDKRRCLPEGKVKTVPQTIRPILTAETRQTQPKSPLDALMENIQSKPDTDDIVQTNETVILQEEERRLGTNPGTSAGQPARRKPMSFHCNFEGCGKECKGRSGLTIHMRAHTGEKKYVGYLRLPTIQSDLPTNILVL